MRTSLIKKYLCIILVLLFLVPTVAALDINPDTEPEQASKTIIKQDKELQLPDSDIPETNKFEFDVPDSLKGKELSIEVQNILHKYNWAALDEGVREFVINHNQLMLARKATWELENPRMPYEPMDVTQNIAKLDPETGEMVSFFPDTQLRRTEPEMCDRSNYKPNNPIIDTQNAKYADPSLKELNTNPTMSNTRAPEADVELDMLEWTYVQAGWGEQYEIETSNNQPVPGNQYYLGAFQTGKKNTFTATVRNNNPGAGSVSVWVNLSISEWYTMTPMQRNPNSKQVSVGSTPVKVTFEFTPPSAGYLLIQCIVDYSNDPDTSNNYIGWRGIPVFIWSADMESGGTNYGWQKLADGSTKQNQASDWTGDMGATNAWHTTSGPANQNAEAHTQQNAWFHGEDVGGALVPDTYGDTMNRNIDDNGRNHTYLETPFINMGDIMDDERTVRGITTENTFYLDYMLMSGWLMTGELEYETNAQNQVTYDGTDIIFYGSYSDSPGGNDWFLVPYPYWDWAYVIGDWSTWDQYLQTPQATPHWNPAFHITTDGQSAYLTPGYPLRLFVSDGNGGVKTNLGGAKNWTNPGVKFRLNLDCDGDDDQTTQTGIYADDFVVWGIQDYMVDKRVGITEITYPTTSGVPIVYKDSTASFTVTVENFGKLYQSLPVKMIVKDSDGNEVAKYTTSKSAGNLPNDEEKDVQFTWQPAEEGDFTVEIEAGSEAEDWTPGDNKETFYVHVSPSIEDSDVDILVVDDDDSVGQLGMFLLNIEDKMLQALRDNDLKYRVFTVEYNETGPTVDVMDDYEMVIWMTGLDNEVWAHGGRSNWNKNNPAWDITLKANDVTELESYLNGKDKKLWFISPGFLYDYYGMDYKTIPPGDFAREYLHILNCQANLTQWNNDNTAIVVQGTPNLLEGVPDSVMDEAEYVTYDSEPPSFFTDIGGVVEKKDPGDDFTSTLFYQDAAHLQHNALLYKGNDHMAAYFGFNFYLINDQEDAKDCVYRLLTGFGMTGGVLVELFSNNERVQWVYPDNSTTYQLKVTNLGKKTDTMELSVKVTYSKDYPTKYKDWKPVFEGTDVVIKAGKPTVTIPGSPSSSVFSSKKNIYLRVTAPAADDYSEYPDANEVVRFTVSALSENTKLENATSCIAKVPIIGRISMDCQDTEETIKVDEIAKFLLELYNETNANEDITVELSFGGEGASLAKFVVNNKPTANKKITVDLSPNEANDDVQLHVTADEHTLAGYHNVTVYLKDESGGEILSEIELTVEVKQFYQVECNTTGDENGMKSFVIDPNEYTDQGMEYITKTFTINVRNHGNGYDIVNLDWEENINSEDMSDWPEPGIYLKSGSGVTNITEIPVIYYSESRNPEYGEEKVYFDVYIPIDIEIGTYRVDFIIESSGTEAVGEAENNKVTFTFKIIKPNLKYTKLDNKSMPNFELYDFDLGEQIIEDPLNEYGDYYLERSYKDFDLLVIEVKVFVLNDGDNEIEVSKDDIWLNITYENEFGDTVYEIYSNLTPISPTSSVIIAPGQRETFTFRWDPETLPNKEPTEYKFEVTVDPENRIYEKDEVDNSASFELFVKHIPKPPKKKGTGGMPGFESAFVIIAIAVVLLGLMYNRRRRH